MRHIRLYIFLYFTVAMLMTVMYLVMDRVNRGQTSEWASILVIEATGYYGFALLLPVIFGIARRFPFRFTAARVGVHLAALLTLSPAHTLWNWGTRLALFPVLGLGSYSYGRMPLVFLMELPIDFMAYGLWTAAYAVYRRWLRAKAMEMELLAARVESLTRQLQPHFLFNALNAISSVMYEDLERADKMLAALSDYLRATLRLADSPKIPLAAELTLTQQYMEVMQTRLEEKLHFSIYCEPGVENTPVPALLLQPLVENAFEHGQDPGSGEVEIDIRAAREGSFLRVAIRDRGPGPPAAAQGRGLSNVRQRLETIYGDEARLKLERHAHGGALVEVQIPA